MPPWDVRFDLAIRGDDPELVQLVAQATALAAVIGGIPISPYRLERLNRLNILRAVRGTTGIEGSDLTEEEVGKVLDAASDQAVLARPREREEREVRNAYRVFEFVSTTLHGDPRAPVTEALVREIHAMTTADIDYEHNSPGRYRAHNVTAGTYAAPAAEKVASLMAAFAAWLNEPPATRWPPVVRAIAAHFYLISIHPFGDGNGRTARAVESYLLYQAGINACGFYSLSNFYYRRRAEYFAMLDHVRFQSGGDLTPFLCFAARGLVEELEAVRTEVFDEVTIVAFRDYAHEQLQNAPGLVAKTRERMYRFLEELGTDPAPVKAIRDGRHIIAALYRGKSLQTLARDIEALVSLGLLVRERDAVRLNIAIMEQYKIRGGLPPRGDAQQE